jgi:hypothetical protein
MSRCGPNGCSRGIVLWPTRASRPKVFTIVDGGRAERRPRSGIPNILSPRSGSPASNSEGLVHQELTFASLACAFTARTLCDVWTGAAGPVYYGPGLWPRR